MNKFNLSWLLILLIIVTANVPGFSADNPNPVFSAQNAEDENQLQINSVEPLKGTVGKDLEVTITGNGFDSTSRVALIPQPYPDYPRLDANDFTSPCFSMDCGEAGLMGVYDNLLFTYKWLDWERMEISIADLSNPIMPIKTGTFSIYKDFRKIALEGHYAYLLKVHYDSPGPSYSLEIIDLNDLSNPKLSGSIGIGKSWVGGSSFGGAVDLDIKNKTVYITCGGSGLRVVDATVPSTPQIVAAYDENDLKGNNIGAFYGIDIDGDNAYIAAGDSGMAVMDISNPAEPSLVKVINTSGDCQDVAISDQAAYLLDKKGMVSIDITTPSDPHIAGALPLFDRIQHNANVIQIKGNYAWVFARDDRQYYMVDIRRPSFPVLVVSANYQGTIFSDNMAYVNKGSCMMLAPIPLELSDITVNSSNILSFTVPAPLINARYKIRVFNDLYSAESQQTLYFDLPGPINNSAVDYPDQVIQTIDLKEYVEYVEIEGIVLTPNGDYAYVPNSMGNTISVIRISDHSVIKTISTGLKPTKIIFSPNGDYAYVINSDDYTVSVISTSDYSIIKDIRVGEYPWDIVMTPGGSFLYVSVNDLSNSLSVIRTSDYKVIGTIPVGTGPSALCIRPDGAYIYALNNSDWDKDKSISVIRSSDNQVETTILLEGGPQAFAMTPNGAYLYVSTNSGYAHVIQTSDNTVIKKIPGIDGAVVTATPDGDHVYAGGRGDEICVIQSSDQTIEKTIHPVCAPSLMAITPKGDYIYFAKSDGTGKIVSVLRTSDNKIIKTIPAGHALWGGISGMVVTPDGKYVYVSNYSTVTVIGNSHDIDDDADGFTENQGDCDDSDPLIIPVPEICGDGIDQDCDGQDQVCCAITVTSPNGGETWKPGSVHQITWDLTGSECGPFVKITYSTDGGGSWHEISAGCPNTGACSWTIPDPFETNQALIKIEDTSSADYFDISDAEFMIQKNNGGGGGGCFISGMFK